MAGEINNPPFDFSILVKEEAEKRFGQQGGNIFDDCLIDLSKAIEEPEPLISSDGKPLFTRGNISCISGKAKSRKTFLIGLFSSQFLERTQKETIIIFDTEQAQFHVQKSTKRIHQLLRWRTDSNNKRLRVFTLRTKNNKERKEFIEQKILHYCPDLVFIDGVRDLVDDFNSPTESSTIVNFLMKMSSETNCHICSVLHQNKADNNLRGHAGTELANKSETVISVEKIDEFVSAVIPVYCRNTPFDKFYFRINEEVLPELCQPQLKHKNTDSVTMLFKEILHESLKYADLVNKIMEKKGIKKRAAERNITSAIEQSIIFKDSADFYYLKTEQDNE